MTRRITVRALHDFHIGPRHANGSREIAIHAGDVRVIEDPAPEARPDDPEPTGTRDGLPFWTVDRWGSRFPQLCRIGEAHGWRVVAIHQPAASTPSARQSASGPAAALPAAPLLPTGGGYAWEGDMPEDDGDDWPI